jgi:hypothetical protein
MRRRKGNTEELAGRLAPLEEQRGDAEAQASSGGPVSVDDTIRVGSASVTLPDRMIEQDRKGLDIFRPDPVVLYILAGVLLFIAFIAWQITLMPAPAR